MTEYQSFFLLVIYLPVFIGLKSLLGASRYLYLLSLSFFAFLGFYLVAGFPSQLHLFPSLCVSYVVVWLSSNIDIRLLMMTSRFQLVLVLILASCWWTEQFLTTFNELGLSLLNFISTASLVFFIRGSKSFLQSALLILSFCIIFTTALVALDFSEQALIRDSYDQLALLALFVVSSSFLVGVFPFHYWWISLHLKIKSQESFFFTLLRVLVLFQILSILKWKLEAYPQILHLLAILSLIGLVIYSLLELVEVDTYTLNIFSFNRIQLSLIGIFLYASLAQNISYFELFAGLGLTFINSNFALISRIARKLKLINGFVLWKELKAFSLKKVMFFLTFLSQLFIYLSFFSWSVLTFLDQMVLAVVILVGANSLYHQGKLYFSSTRRSSS